MGHHIAGRRVAGTSGRSAPVFDPARGEVVCQVALASTEEVDRAVDVAVGAAPGWARAPLAQRTEVMFEVRAALRRGIGELAELITRENGKTLADALGEVRRGLESVEFACGLAANTAGTHSTSVASGVDVHSLREPLGVVGCITPFNFPVMVPLWMLANALSVGNAVVFKPSERAPSAPLRLVELMEGAGLPRGVLNVVNGDKSAVDRILDHTSIDAISFVGSTPVASSIYTRASAAGKRVQALGGAKNHMVVLPDADLAAAADAAIGAAYGAAGERCMAVSAVVAVGPAADGLVAALAERLGRLRVGPGTEEVDYGPLVTAAHRARVASYLDLAHEQGAEIVVDGRTHPVCDGPGFFLGPSLLDRVTTGMTPYQDEIFGPVLSVLRVETLNDALRMVNENPYGNGTAIFTRDGRAARRFERESKIGMVGVNVPIPVPVGWFSFGGWKSSLFGDSHMYGPDGVRFFTRQKVVTARW
ncbi:MAG: CoA-acylating methylmalonate-semialdehyde dehydrogenase [Pseudonocardia sp.]